MTSWKNQLEMLVDKHLLEGVLNELYLQCIAKANYLYNVIEYYNLGDGPESRLEKHWRDAADAIAYPADHDSVLALRKEGL